VLRLCGDKVAATATATFFAIIPYSIFYSRTILPEPTLVLFSVLSLLGFSYWITSKKHGWQSTIWYVLSLLSFTLALLVKPTALFIAPVFVALSFTKYGWKAFLQPMLWLFLVSLIPLGIWRWWILKFPEGIPASKWLLNGNGIRLRPSWWRWLFADRLSRLILGYWGVVVVSFGIISQYSKKFKLFDVLTLSWAAGMLLYLIVFATGNVQHDYYQVQLIPILSILFGRGFSWLTADTKDTNRILKCSLAIATTGLMLLFSWFEVSGFFNINNPAIVSAGQATNRLTPADAIVIAPYQGDTAFLYQTNRRGWPIGFQIDERINRGATHYITTAYDDEAKQLESKYFTIEKTNDYLLLDLTKSADDVTTEQTQQGTQ
jgi:4-amino-4-deoxy-L-arabinose transferase-like glycosyltransferase